MSKESQLVRIWIELYRTAQSALQYIPHADLSPEERSDIEAELWLDPPKTSLQASISEAKRRIGEAREIATMSADIPLTYILDIDDTLVLPPPGEEPFDYLLEQALARFNAVADITESLIADGGNDALLGVLIASDLEKVEPLGIHEVLRGYLHDLDREIHRIALQCDDCGRSDLGDRLLAIVQGGQNADY